MSVLMVSVVVCWCREVDFGAEQAAQVKQVALEVAEMDKALDGACISVQEADGSVRVVSARTAVLWCVVLLLMLCGYTYSVATIAIKSAFI